MAINNKQVKDEKFWRRDIVKVSKSVTKIVEVIEPKRLVISPLMDNLYYTIFVMDVICRKYLLSETDVMKILYLYELGLFGWTIKLPHGGFRVFELREMGYVEKDTYSTENSIYKLTSKGVELVEYYIELFNNKDKWVGENRALDVTDKAGVKSAFNDYFK